MLYLHAVSFSACVIDQREVIRTQQWASSAIDAVTAGKNSIISLIWCFLYL